MKNILRVRQQIGTKGINILHQYFQNMKTDRIKIIFFCIKIFMIAGLYIFGYNCMKNFNLIVDILILIWITLIAIVLLSSDILHSYFIKKEIYRPHILLAALTPIWCFYIIESYNLFMDEMALDLWIGNVVIMSLVFLLFYINVPYKRVVVGVYWTVFYLFGLGNYYVTRFRGTPVMPNDILSIGTAIQVAGGYSYDISGNIFFMSFNYVNALILSFIFPAKKVVIQWKYVLLKLVLSLIVFFGLSNIRVESVFGFELADNQWKIDKFYISKGSVIGFTTFLQNMNVKTPENYQRRTVEAILSDYTECVDSDNNTRPTIITVMDESFSDLRSLADFYTTEEYLYNWYNIDDYLYKGNLYVSIYGAQTATTEFEFLTENSNANLPSGIVSYQMYNLKNVGNIADILNRNGYQTIAVHPANRENWNRAKVYEEFGFSSFLDREAFQGADIFGGLISDKADLEKVIDIFESSNEPQFIFNITLQNHGGYDDVEFGTLKTVELEDGEHQYKDVETYLTLIKESDKAIDDFIDYFRTVDEPVIICVFGDHWPRIDDVWIEQTAGKPMDSFTLEETQRLRAVPYMIWTNYDVELSGQTCDTSANYLGALLLDAAGVSTSSYTEYLLDMRKHVPVLNNLGYMTNDGMWHSFEETTDVSQWIDNYKMLQYYAMFDSARDMTYYLP